MKKGLISGLVLLLMGCLGCQPNASTLGFNEQVKEIKHYSNKLKEIIEIKEGESYQIFEPEKEGGVYHVIVKEEGGMKSIMYLDTNQDGVYDTKTILKIPDKLDMKIILPKIEKEGEKRNDSEEENKKKLLANYRR